MKKLFYFLISLSFIVNYSATASLMDNEPQYDYRQNPTYLSTNQQSFAPDTNNNIQSIKRKRSFDNSSDEPKKKKRKLTDTREKSQLIDTIDWYILDCLGLEKTKYGDCHTNIKLAGLIETKDIKKLKSFSNLQSLDISGISSIDEEIIKNIAKYPSIETLIMSEHFLRNDWLKPISNLHNLKYVDLSGTYVTDKIFDYFNPNTLERIILRLTLIGKEGIPKRFRSLVKF